MVQHVKNGFNGKQLSKIRKMVKKMVKKWPKITKDGKNGSKWSKLVKIVQLFCVGHSLSARWSVLWSVRLENWAQRAPRLLVDHNFTSLANFLLIFLVFNTFFTISYLISKAGLYQKIYHGRTILWSKLNPSGIATQKCPTSFRERESGRERERGGEKEKIENAKKYQ